jgi:hypothetical protein
VRTDLQGISHLKEIGQIRFRARGQTGRLQLAFGALLAVGLAVGL